MHPDPQIDCRSTLGPVAGVVTAGGRCPEDHALAQSPVQVVIGHGGVGALMDQLLSAIGRPLRGLLQALVALQALLPIAASFRHHSCIMPHNGKQQAALDRRP
jgi:hypothetical protein